MGRSPRQSLFVKIKRQGGREDYTYAFVIAGKNLRLKSSANGTVYQLCDIAQNLPETIDCHGISRPVTMILKIYSRIPERELKKQRERARYQQLLRGKMMLSND